MLQQLQLWLLLLLVFVPAVLLCFKCYSSSATFSPALLLPLLLCFNSWAPSPAVSTVTPLLQLLLLVLSLLLCFICCSTSAAARSCSKCYLGASASAPVPAPACSPASASAAAPCWYLWFLAWDLQSGLVVGVSIAHEVCAVTHCADKAVCVTIISNGILSVAPLDETSPHELVANLYGFLDICCFAT